MNVSSPEQGRTSSLAPGASVTFVVQHRVRADAFPRYEEWLKRIVAVCSTYPGYQGVDIIRPVAGDNEYSTIVRFATFADAQRWCKSADRPRLIVQIKDILEREDRARIQTGIDFWFTPAQAQLPHARPWKQWLVTTSVIWPLTLVVPFLFEPLFRAVPWLGMAGVRHAIVAAAIVALAVFLIMPRYVRLISSWLYADTDPRVDTR